MTPSQTLQGASTPPTLPAEALAQIPSHHHRQFEVMGAQHRPEATTFTVWAPNARSVAVVGSFNGWKAEPRLTVSDWADEHRVLAEPFRDHLDPRLQRAARRALG